MTQPPPSPPRAAPLGHISVASLAWLAAAALFLGLRIGPIWQAPVGGAELVHLSGAWQARAGLDDPRFVPTLFQAIAALYLFVSDSEVLPRVAAFLATASVPAALYLLRARMGDAAALISLVILALDAPAILLSVTASAMAFDLALTLWLFVALARGEKRPWAWAVLAFLVATAGPLPLSLAAGAGVVSLLQARYPARRSIASAGAGAAVGVGLASFGFGFQAGPFVVPPFVLFAHGYDQAWSTATAAEVMVLYGWPVFVAGLAALAWAVPRALAERPRDRITLVLFAWAGVALFWFLSAANTQSSVAVVALTTPLALAVGPAAVAALNAMVRADWRLARFLLPGAALAAALALAVAADWARLGRSGGGDDWRQVVLLAAVSATAVVAAAWGRQRAPTLVAAFLGVASIALLAGAFGVALSGVQEPIPSPVSPRQARLARDVTLELAGGRDIAVHERYADAITWPFRDSGDIIIATRVPERAAVILWPTSLPPPPGFTRLEGQWAMLEYREPPTGAFLDYLHWVIDRNTIVITADRAVVYSRDEP